MRRVRLGTVSVKGVETSVARQLIAYLENAPANKAAPQAGLDSGTMRQRFKVADLIENAANAGHVDLPEERWLVLRSAIENVTYLFGDRGLIEIEDRVFDAVELGAGQA